MKAINTEFTAMSGKRFKKDDLENPSRPGFLKDELCPIESDTWSAAAFFDLLTPSGRRMGYMQAAPDPLVVRRDEAPAALLAEAAAAQASLDRVLAENAAERERMIKAERDEVTFDPHESIDEKTLRLAAEGSRSSIVLLTSAQVAPLEAREQAPRKALSVAEGKVQAWLRDEAIRRARPHVCPKCSVRLASPDQLKHHQREHGANQQQLTVQTIGKLTRRALA